TIARPETIEDSDSILEKTASKPNVDLCRDREFFNEFLTRAIELRHVDPANTNREAFRDSVLRIGMANSIKQSEKTIVFAAGGYGSGKTTVVREMAGCGSLPVGVGKEHMIGVDYFKLYIPEFSLIQMAADGRASLTVQDECKHLSER